MPKPEKIKAIKDIKKYLQESKSVFITDFSGLNVSDLTLLRKNLRENSVKYLIAKNTLMRIAAKDAGYENIIDYLDGPTALAFAVDDPVVPAKILYDSYKEKEKPIIKAFITDDQLFAGSEISRLAELPPRDILLAGLVSMVESPLNSLVCSIDGVFRELVSTLEALAVSKE